MPDEVISQEDDLYADVMAAYREVADKGEGEGGAVKADALDTSTSAGDKTATPAEKALVKKDELGRFAKSDTSTAKVEEGDKPGAEKSSETPAGEVKPTAQTSGPPSSWSVKSKAAWDQLPADVKSDIAKREGEVAQGFAALREYKDLKPYADMAQKAGVPLATSMKYYVDMETLLKKDVGAGLATIAQNCGLTQEQAAGVFTSLAQKFGGKSVPAANGGANPPPNDPLYSILKPFIEPLQQEVTTLRQSLTSRDTADRNVATESLGKAIETFSTAPENRYFAELGDTITRLFETGMVPLTGNHAIDLRTAYDTAAQMVPEVREALIEQRLQGQKAAELQKEKEATAKAKNASRSINGSRVPGAVVIQQTPTSQGFDDVEADVRAAYRQAAQR